MNAKIYTKGLPSDAEKIRKEVFVNEQGFQNEFDSIDNIAVHIVLYNSKEVPIATCRVFWNSKLKAYMIGRLAVLKEYRGKHLGSDILKVAEEYICDKGGHSVVLHAQCRVSSFYQKLGFVPYGKVDNDEGCLHIWMKKEI